MKIDKWEEIFDKFEILKKIQDTGRYEITSSQINQFREARLMTKFDNASQLPKIFTENKLSILPITRGSYVISPMEIFCKFPTIDHSSSIQYFNFPDHIQSLSPEKINSEALALNCVYLSGILADFIEDDHLLPTICGKMSSLSFNFNVKSSISNSYIPINIDKASIEIDGGYEGIETLSIIEAKNHLSDDFVIRQLYYPYRRLLLSKIEKKIKPIFLVYTNNIFYLYEYEFADVRNYNSLKLKRLKRYSFEKVTITVDDIEKILKQIIVAPEPAIPFPRADSFERVINLCELLNNSPLSKSDITINYGFDKRQTDYYVNAGKYLGLIETNKSGVSLTQEGYKIMSETQRNKQLGFVKKILGHSIFNEVLKQQIKNGKILAKQEIISIMKKFQLFNCQSEETYNRRASTVTSWIDWITSLTLSK